MEKQKEKIMRFSKVIHILLNISIIILIVIGALSLIAWFVNGSNLPTQIMSIDGVDMEVPVLFKLGNTTVSLPIVWKSDFDYNGILRLIPGIGIKVGISDLIGIAFTIVALRYAKKVFKQLRENNSPFREDTVKALKGLTIVLLITGVVSGAVPFLAAGIVWVICLVFDYGCTLQNESDTTL